MIKGINTLSEKMGGFLNVAPGVSKYLNHALYTLRDL